jgi:5-oxoprolinase (ATP-hydrolysing) subunit A
MIRGLAIAAAVAAERRSGTMAQTRALDINVDMGESFGRWVLGDDDGIMPFISSASIACGFHAGDPATMRRTVRSAIAHGVQIGAHVALPDLLGFGRRRMAVAPDDLRDYTAYQIGALWSFATAEGGEIGHVKPHGALYAMCSADPELAGAVAGAIAEIDSDMALLLLNRNVADAVESHGVQLVTEAFVDLEYNPDGSLIIEAVKRAWDPERVARRALRLVEEHVIDAVDGSDVPSDAPTICIHGDGPNAVEIAKAVRGHLERAGIDIEPLKRIRERHEQVQR